MTEPPAPTVDGTTLRHTDECIRDVRRCGFCEHDTLPLVRYMAETRTVPWRVAHPVKYEVITSLGVAAVFTANLYLTIKLGWPGILAFTATGRGLAHRLHPGPAFLDDHGLEERSCPRTPRISSADRLVLLL